MGDRERVLTFIDIAEQRAGQLQAWVPEDLDTYLEDVRTASAVERSLQVAIEALWDSGYLFVRGLRLGLPADEHALPQRLRSGGILDADEAALLEDLRKFRNVLVHRYGELDPKQVYTHARNAPEDIQALSDAYRRSLDQLESQ